MTFRINFGAENDPEMPPRSSARPCHSRNAPPGCWEAMFSIILYKREHPSTALKSGTFQGLRPLPPTPKKGHDIGKHQEGIIAGVEERPGYRRVLAGERATEGPAKLWQLWNPTEKHMYSEQRKRQKKRRRKTEQERRRGPHRKISKVNGNKR